jgi:uncharacterized membrane protein
MNVVLWVAAGLLALIVSAAGVEKLATPFDQLRVKRPWVETASPRSVRALGALEVIGAVGLIAPAVSGIAPWLVPLAALGLAGLMLGALTVEARRHPSVAVLALPAVTLALAVLVAIGRSVARPL